MKIERSSKDIDAFRARGKHSGREVSASRGGSFDSDLNQQQEGLQRQKMEEILAGLAKVNARLASNLNINDLMLYKKMVRDFLKEATARAYRIEQQRGRHRRGRALLVSIQTVDDEMEAMIKDFIDKKTDPMDVLETLDKIRGMLVDLMA